MTRDDLIGTLIFLGVALVVITHYIFNDGEQGCVPWPSAVEELFMPECMDPAHRPIDPLILELEFGLDLQD